MKPEAGPLETFFPRISRDTVAQLERLLSSLLVAEPPLGAKERLERAIPAPPASTHLSLRTSNETAEKSLSLRPDGIGINLDYSYSILVKAVGIVEEAFSSFDLQVQKSNLGLRKQLARTEQAYCEWRSRAMDAEDQLGRLLAAISKL